MDNSKKPGRKLIHSDTSYLLLQQEFTQDKIQFNKVPGTNNPADMNTSGLNAKLSNRTVHREGRAELAPGAGQLQHELQNKRLNPIGSENKTSTMKLI